MNILGLMVGEAPNVEKAEEICKLFEGCPYKKISTAKDRQVLILFSIPEDHRWWLEGLEREPEKTLGLSEAKVFFSEMPEYPLEVADQREDAPCGSDCKKCDFFNEMCNGCPSVYGYSTEQ